MEGLVLHSNNSNSKKQLVLGMGIGRKAYQQQQWKSPCSSSAYKENLDLDSPLLGYLRSGSPDSPNTRSVTTSPEEVLVMDGILVGSLPARRFASSSSDSGGKTFYKTDICRSWEDSGICRYASKCQFAHGKEELRPTRFPIKNKSEAQMFSPYIGTGSGTYGLKSRRFVPLMAAEAAAMTTQTASPTKPEHSSNSPTTSKITIRDWSPKDDGFEVCLPHPSTQKPPSRKDINAYSQSVLYGPSTRKRLPVFAEICLEY